MKKNIKEKLIRRSIPVDKLPLITELTESDELIVNSYLYTTEEATSSIITVKDFIKEISGGDIKTKNGIFLGVSTSSAENTIKDVLLIDGKSISELEDGMFLSIQFSNGHSSPNGLFVNIPNLGTYEVLYDVTFNSMVSNPSGINGGKIPANLIKGGIIYNLVFVKNKFYITGVIESQGGGSGDHDPNILYIPTIYRLIDLQGYSPEDVYNLYSVLVGTDLKYVNKLISMVHTNNYILLNVKEHTNTYTTFTYLVNNYFTEFKINHNNGQYSLEFVKENVTPVMTWA